MYLELDSFLLGYTKEYRRKGSGKKWRNSIQEEFAIEEDGRPVKNRPAVSYLELNLRIRLQAHQTIVCAHSPLRITGTEVPSVWTPSTSMCWDPIIQST